MTVGLDRPIRLEPVARCEVTIVVDNFVDVLMAGSDGVRRYLATDFGDRDQLIAEHGFSALITVELHGGRSSVLYDGGPDADGAWPQLGCPADSGQRPARACDLAWARGPSRRA